MLELQVIVTGPEAHLARESHGPAVDVDHAIRKVVSVVANIVHANTLCGRVCLRWRMVRAELWVFANHACLARNILVAFDLPLPAWIASL